MKSLALFVTPFLFQIGQATTSKIDYYTWPKYDDRIKSAMQEHLSGKDFETWKLDDLYLDVPRQMAAAIGAKYGLFCNSGTSGLHASLMALGLKPKDKVVVPAMTFIRAVTPLSHLGLTPILADVEPETGNLSVAALEKMNDPGIKAVVVVHMWGVPADIGAIKKICDQRKWFLIEDYSHAHFSRSDAGFAGAVGDVGYASMQRKKTFSVGEGGIIVTQNETIFKRLQDITSPGSFNQVKGKPTDYSGFGLNMRMAPTSAVLAKGLFAQRDEVIAIRQGSANIVLDMLRKYPDIFHVSALPKHVKEVVWYALRFKSGFSEEQFKSAAAGTRWKFTDIAYQPIYDEVFWQKDSKFFPFAQMAKPKKIEAPGLVAYMQGRLGVKIPNLTPAQWSQEERQGWLDELATVVASLKRSPTN